MADSELFKDMDEKELVDFQLARALAYKGGNMNIVTAFFRIPSRELTRRLVWLAAYCAALAGNRVAVTLDAETAVMSYDQKFPQSK